MDVLDFLRGGTILKKTSKRSIHQNIGARLAQIRKQRGMTQIELANRLGTEQPFISNYERGELRLHAKVILQIADALKVTTDELLGRRAIKKVSSPKTTRLLKRMKRIEDLSIADRRAVLKYLEALLGKQNAKK